MPESAQIWTRDPPSPSLMDTSRVDGVKRTTGLCARTLELDVVLVERFDQIVWRDDDLDLRIFMSRQLQNGNGPELLDLLQLLLDFILFLRDLDLR